MKNIFKVAAATALLCGSLSTSVLAVPVMTAGQPTTARNLHAIRMAFGYRLSGQLQSSNTCMNTRFRVLPAPDSFVAEQYKRPGSGPICGFIVTWKPTQLSVSKSHVPRYAHVHVAGGRVIRVPINPIVHPE